MPRRCKDEWRGELEAEQKMVTEKIRALNADINPNPEEQHIRGAGNVDQAANRKQVFNFRDHVVPDAMEQMKKALAGVQLVASEVSRRNQNNSFIDALLQHATGRYEKRNFNLSHTIRKEVAPNFKGMFLPDEKYAREVLERVNAKTGSRIWKVTVIVWTIDGPLMIGGTQDNSQAAAGVEVVIWRQHPSRHFVAITADTASVRKAKNT